jgi:hypothetical protein
MLKPGHGQRTSRAKSEEDIEGHPAATLIHSIRLFFVTNIELSRRIEVSRELQTDSYAQCTHADHAWATVVRERGTRAFSRSSGQAMGNSKQHWMFPSSLYTHQGLSTTPHTRHLPWISTASSKPSMTPPASYLLWRLVLQACRLSTPDGALRPFLW